MRAAANFRHARSSTLDPGPDFPTFGLGKRLLYIRRDFAPRAPIVFERLAALEQDIRAAYARWMELESLASDVPGP